MKNIRLLWPFCTLLCFTLSGCFFNKQPQTQVLEYADFGPQAMAYPLLGKDAKKSSSTLNRHPTYVVVYNDIPLSKVKKKYPLNPEKNIEYRYVPIDAAMEFLQENILQDYWEAVTQRLLTTRTKLESLAAAAKASEQAKLAKAQRKAEKEQARLAKAAAKAAAKQQEADALAKKQAQESKPQPSTPDTPSPVEPAVEAQAAPAAPTKTTGAKEEPPLSNSDDAAKQKQKESKKASKQQDSPNETKVDDDESKKKTKPRSKRRRIKK